MLAAHAVPDPRELYTVSAGGFSATADAFARDPDSEGLWFLSMVGSQSAVKAIWAALLKQPPAAAHLLAGTDGMALSGGFHGCAIPTRRSARGQRRSRACPSRAAGTRSSTRAWPSTPSSGKGSCCSPPARRRRPPCISASSTAAVPCRCTAPGRSGCGGGGWRGARFFHCSRRASTPTAANPTPKRCAWTSPWRWRRER